MKLDKAFEEAVLSRALKDTNFLKRASRLLEPHHFASPQHGWVWKTTRDIWTKYRERASARLILARAKVDFKLDEDREPYIELVRKLYKKKGPASASLDELSKFVRTVNAQLAMESAATDLERGKLNEVYETLRQCARQEAKPREYTSIKWIEEFKERQRERKHRREHPDDYLRIPTGFKRLDKIIDGIELGELGLVLATTNKGKSIMLSNFAYESVRQRVPTAYFSLEMPARQIAMRQDARWLEIPYNKFKHYEWKPSELRDIKRRLKKMRPKWKGMFRIISVPIERCDINVIRNALDDLRHDEGFDPKLILVDSGDHMNGVGRFESYRLEQKSVYMGLKTLAEEEGVGVWTSTHAGREWAETTATAEATGESYDKARIADIVVSLNTPKKRTRSTKVEFNEDGEAKSVAAPTTPPTVGTYIELFLAKYRDGASRITIPLDADFARMLIQEIDTKVPD